VKDIMEATWPVTLRRYVMVATAGLLVGTVLHAAESAVGIGFWWRMALNQIPMTALITWLNGRVR
jgi:hypothetical protein